MLAEGFHAKYLVTKVYYINFISTFFNIFLYNLANFRDCGSRIAK